ncbi:MAG: hypothetical protein IPL62_05685 [Caulobacteraceae bacterium]|nr:hypothetical protein [Caulobacteraceae bacterium]
MSEDAPEAHLRAMQALARQPDDPEIAMSVSWVNGDVTVGVTVTDDDASVFFNGASEPLLGFSDAEDLLRRIFADEIACVTGYHREQFVFCRLAPADKVAEQLPNARSRASQLKLRGQITISTWSRGVLAENE